MGPIMMLLVFGLLGSLVGGSALAVIEGATAYGAWRDRRAADSEALARLASLALPGHSGPEDSAAVEGESSLVVVRSHAIILPAE